MRVKIFIGADPLSLQTDINRWIKDEGWDIEIETITQSERTNTERDSFPNITISIWYKHIKK